MTDDIDDSTIPEGIEHLRRAAREMIAASRALLDVVEEVVERPDTVGELLEMVGAVGEQIRRASTGASRGGRDPFLREDDDEDRTDRGVFRIPVD